jgi:hypothetical protein
MSLSTFFLDQDLFPEATQDLPQDGRYSPELNMLFAPPPPESLASSEESSEEYQVGSRSQYARALGSPTRAA